VHRNYEAISRDLGGFRQRPAALADFLDSKARAKSPWVKQDEHPFAKDDKFGSVSRIPRRAEFAGTTFEGLRFAGN
jgi:hypothetical protein